MTAKKKTKYHFYEGLIFVLPNWAVYREVSREDLEDGNPVFALKIAGLEYASIENLLKPIQINEQTFEVRDGIEYVRHGGADGVEVLCVTPTQTFTGTDRRKGEFPEMVYLTLVTLGVTLKNALRCGGVINVRI